MRWRSRIAVRARPEHVIAVLTDPRACSRWSPVGFDVHDLDGNRLTTGSSATVTGRLHGWPLRFTVDVSEVRNDRLALRAVGPVEMLVDYSVTPTTPGSAVAATIALTPRGGRRGALIARLAELLLRAGALEHALSRIAGEAERLQCALASAPA